LSLPASFLALRAIKHNCIKNISFYIKWIVAFGVLPVIYGFFIYLPDVYTFITKSPSTESIQLWRVSILLLNCYLFICTKIIFSIAEFPLWYTLVYIYCDSSSNSWILNIFCTKFEKGLDCQGNCSKEEMNDLLGKIMVI